MDSGTPITTSIYDGDPGGKRHHPFSCTKLPNSLPWLRAYRESRTFHSSLPHYSSFFSLVSALTHSFFLHLSAGFWDYGIPGFRVLISWITGSNHQSLSGGSCLLYRWVPLIRLDERSHVLRRLSLARSPEVRLNQAAFLKSQLLLGGPGTPTDYVNQHQF